jgi:hypothetical protein
MGVGIDEGRGRWIYKRNRQTIEQRNNNKRELALLSVPPVTTPTSTPSPAPLKLQNPPPPPPPPRRKKGNMTRHDSQTANSIIPRVIGDTFSLPANQNKNADWQNPLPLHILNLTCTSTSVPLAVPSEVNSNQVGQRRYTGFTTKATNTKYPPSSPIRRISQSSESRMVCSKRYNITPAPAIPPPSPGIFVRFLLPLGRPRGRLLALGWPSI